MRTVLVIFAVLYLLSPIFVGGGLYYELQAGSFPPESDAIAIPFMGFMVLWLAGLIVGSIVLIGIKIFRKS